MSANFVEELVSEFYRLRGYLVMTNYWFSIQTARKRNQRGADQEYSARSWSDIDVLAVGHDEVILVQVKAIVNEASVAEKIKGFFVHAEEFVQRGLAPDGSSPISWWETGKVLKKVLVYEYYSPPKYLNQLRAAGIEVHEFSSFFDEILDYIHAKNGVKEENALMRMIHFLTAKKYLVHDPNRIPHRPAGRSKRP